MKYLKYIFSVLFFINIFINISCKFNPGGEDPHLPAEPFINGTVTGINNFPMQNVLACVNSNCVYTDIFGGFFINGLPDLFDLYLKVPVQNYEIVYKDVSMGASYMHLPIPLNQNTDEYSISVQYPAIPQPEKGKLYFITNGGMVFAQNIDSSSNINFRLPKQYYNRGKVVFISYTTDNEGKINAYKYYGESFEINPEPGVITYVSFTSNLIQALSTVINYNCNVIPPTGSSNVNASLIFNFNYTRRIYADINSQIIQKYSGNNFTVKLPSNFNSPFFRPLLNFTTEGSSGFTEEMRVFPSGSSADFNLTGVPVVTSPENYANNVDANTVFSIERQNISRILIFTLIDSASSRRYNLCTSENNITMSMLSKMVTLEPNKTYSYTVQQTGIGINNVKDYLIENINLSEFKAEVPVRYFTAKPTLK